MSYKIYSIVYDINQCSEYERYDNSHIKTIEDKSYLFEYNPIIDITSKQIEEEYLGIFSYKFYIKNLVTKKKLLQRLESPIKFEIYGLSKFSNKNQFGLDFAEKAHPGFSDIFYPLCEDLGLTTKQPEYMIHSNFFIAKTEIYKDYVNSVVIPAIELMETKYKDLCWRKCEYRGASKNIFELTGLNHYTFHTFVLERLINQYYTTKKLNFKQLQLI